MWSWSKIHSTSPALCCVSITGVSCEYSDPPMPSLNFRLRPGPRETYHRYMNATRVRNPCCPGLTFTSFRLFVLQPAYFFRWVRTPNPTSFYQMFEALLMDCSKIGLDLTAPHSGCECFKGCQGTCWEIHAERPSSIQYIAMENGPFIDNFRSRVFLFFHSWHGLR